MPKLKPATQIARRANILDAAEQCFAAHGFHRCTMQDICKAAGVSAGAVYVYFPSKEALIAGICERDRAKLAAQFAALAEAPDLLEALAGLGHHYAIEEPVYKRKLAIEMGLESTRDPAIAEIFQSVDRFCKESFVKLFERARADGRIAPKLDSQTLADVVATIGDGMFWRRAMDASFDPQPVLAAFVGMVAALINPISPAALAATPDKALA